MDLELVGLAEVAELAKVRTTVVSNWQARDRRFPPPVVELRSGPVFERQAIIRYLRRRGRPVAHVISTINLKGGVGKTTTTVGLAEFLSAEFGKKVLVIDLDPQTNATTVLIGEDKWRDLNDAGHTLATLFTDALAGEGQPRPMTSRLLTPWCTDRPASRTQTSGVGGVSATRILDWRSPAVQALLVELLAMRPSDDQALLRQAHRLIAARVRPVYALDDTQSVSRTLALGRGSCSQRLAVLEAVARSADIPTRVRGLLVDGRFWYPRFPRMRLIVPIEVLLAWPEFHLKQGWTGASELFGPVGSLSGRAGFSNADGETLFDALTRTAVDWDGSTSTPEACSACDLSATIVHDFGRFESRDELFSRHGQTLCWPARTLGGPVMGRWAAGTSVPAA